MNRVTICCLVALFAVSAACRPQSPAPDATQAPSPVGTSSTPEPLFSDVETRLDDVFTGDLEAMIARRVIRAGVVFNRTQYFVDKGVQRGITYESLKSFEQQLNARLGAGTLKVHVVIVPLPRDRLFSALQQGTVDLVAATLTVTPERRAVADFSAPTRSGVAEVVVTAPHVLPVPTADDLSGREVFVRRSSSYHESLRRLNVSLAARGRPPVIIVEAPEALEDDDLLEMVNAGLVDITIVDDFVAEFWQQVFPDMRIMRGAAVHAGGEIAVAVRKNSPQLLGALNRWIAEHGPRTTFGNIMNRRYLHDARYVRNATGEAELRRLRSLIDRFETYGRRYDVDYVLMAAQGYQESRLDQSVRSDAGAIGVMQVMPATGRDMAVGNIAQLDPNIHAGVKYFRFMMDEYYRDDPMDRLNRGLMTLASYNAGPGRMRALRAEAARRGLDPNVWFGSVERVVSERVGRETVDYVSNIYKYYVAYRLLLERQRERDEARSSLRPRT